MFEFTEFDIAEPGGAIRLKSAEWDHGGRAWLAARGLQYLRAPDLGLPEITLTLRDGRLSGWISTGQSYGDDYSGGSAEEATPFQRIEPKHVWESATSAVSIAL